MTKQKIAGIISAIFDPLVEAPVLLIILFLTQSPIVLFKLFLIFLVLFSFYLMIVVFWKISGHMTANTAFVLFINLFLGWRYWWLVVLLPSVAWARLTRNKHDIWQLLGGVVLSSSVILCGVSLFF